MSTLEKDKALISALPAIPLRFRSRIVDSYLSVRSAHADGYFDTTGLRAAKFCEAVIRFLQEHLTQSHITFGQRIPNFSDECMKLQKLPKTAGHETLRVVIPRALNFLYTLRNKRGVGHIGGDVDANQIDAATAMRLADWCVCELIRFFHNMSLEEAQEILDALAIRQMPEIWAVGGKRRVLKTGLNYRSQVLLLLHQSRDTAILIEDLWSWVEHSHMANFKRDVIRPLHRERLIEYDVDTETLIISPKGVEQVEREILPKLRG